MNSMCPPPMRYTQIMRIDEPFASVSPTLFLTIFLSLIGWWKVIFVISLFIHTFIQAFHSIKDHYHYYGTNYDLKKMRQQNRINRRIPRYTRGDGTHNDDTPNDKIHTDDTPTDDTPNDKIQTDDAPKEKIHIDDTPKDKIH